MNGRTILASVALSLFLGGTTRAQDDGRAELTAKELAQFKPIAAGIQAADILTLYEGLPHQNIEADKLKQELANKQTIRIHEFPFYKRPLPVKQDDIEPLRQLAAAANSYWSAEGAEAKLCGGFHPDYCLSWTAGDATYELLICLGCQEMRLYGPRLELHLDIRDDAYESFAGRLKKYHDQRPPRK